MLQSTFYTTAFTNKTPAGSSPRNELMKVKQQKLSHQPLLSRPEALAPRSGAQSADAPQPPQRRGVSRPRPTGRPGGQESRVPALPRGQPLSPSISSDAAPPSLPGPSPSGRVSGTGRAPLGAPCARPSPGGCFYGAMVPTVLPAARADREQLLPRRCRSSWVLSSGLRHAVFFHNRWQF